MIAHNTLWSTGVSSQKPEAGLGVGSASENTVGGAVHPHYLGLLSATWKQNKCADECHLLLLIPELQVSQCPVLTSWQKGTIVRCGFNTLRRKAGFLAER